MSEPTTEKLARALTFAGAPSEIVAKARAGYYDDFKGPLAFPITQLVEDARALGLETIAASAIDGAFDATKEESDAWVRSPEGQAIFRELTK